MRLGLFTGTITLDKIHFNVRQIYIIERLRYLIGYKNLEITLICPESNYEGLINLNCNYVFFKSWKKRSFKVITSMIPAILGLLRVRCDIIHCYSNELAIAVIIAQRIRRKQFQIFFEPMGVAEDETKINAKSSIKSRMLRPFIILKERFIIKNINYLIVYTEAMREYYSNHYGLSESNIFVVPYGGDINTKEHSKNDVSVIQKSLNIVNKKVIVYSGSFSELHGTPTLLKIIKIFQEIDSQIIFVLIGSGPLESQIEKYVLKENLKNIILLGHIPRENVPLYLELGDILIIPHAKCGPKTEVDAPTKLFEYFYAGKPIVASNLKAIAEIAEENIMLVEPDNPNAFVQGILKVLNDEELAKKLGENGIRIAQNYSWEISAKKAYEAYEKIWLKLNNSG
jgi:glycosyltransferase involved in cell wall biosynthesis